MCDSHSICIFKEGNPKAVEILFSHFDAELKEKQLEVLANFPETMCPDEYERLLPRIEFIILLIITFKQALYV